MPFYICDNCQVKNFVANDQTSCPVCSSPISVNLSPEEIARKEALAAAARKAEIEAEGVARQAEEAERARRAAFVAALPKWEYKTVLRSRGWNTPSGGKVWQEATEWNTNINEIAALGEQGWELVAVVPRSSYLGGYQERNPPYPPPSTDYAGFTDQELWVFKRPKP